jgi:hypothetical protein
MDSPTPPRTASFSHHAATLSWVCPIITVIIFVLLIFGRQIIARKMIAAVAACSLWLVVVGLIFGLVALFGISKHGTKGILVPAIVGIIINGLLLSFVVASVVTSRVRAMQLHGSIEASPIVAIRFNPQGIEMPERSEASCQSIVEPAPVKDPRFYGATFMNIAIDRPDK